MNKIKEVIKSLKSRYIYLFHDCNKYEETLKEVKEVISIALPDNYKWREVGRAKCRICGQERMLF